ncbi:MAG: signal peptidase I [Proteobacteria bacterium]|nr:signal peptidase I [Pseudomonadota bacterium]MCL2310063.1 signal peptidase I [Pseudomonadota bacterium]
MNFPLILFLLTLITGVIWALDFFYLRKKRDPKAPTPAWIDYTASFFPILLIVFALRSFVAEPFKIPSSSMRPTLEVGDFILVNKFSYGIRLPIIEKKIIPIGSPQRGDVVVFRYPLNPSQDYIKRVIGIPGDVIEYRDKKLKVNEQLLPQQKGANYSYLEGGRFENLDRFTETAQSADGAREHPIAIDPRKPTLYLDHVFPFPLRSACEYFENGFRCTVPKGYYWMMGDNRDNSEDSRYWGFVPDENLRGKAFFIWFNWGDISSFSFNRVGHGIK